MTQTGSTPSRKNRKRGSACAAVERRRRVVVEGAPAGRGPLLPVGQRRAREDEPGGDRRGAVDEEEVAEGDRREDPADRRADRHAEVDRQAVDGEGGLPARGLDGLGEERHGRRPERLGQHREDDRDRGDRDPPFREGIDEERRTREEQRGAHERHAAPLVREPAGERGADDGAGAVEKDDEAGLLRREAAVAGQVQDQEREHHRARAVDELGRRDEPHRARQEPQVFPILQHGCREWYGRSGARVMRSASGARRPRRRGGRARP